MNKVCPKCGSPNHIDARFCYSCGASMEGAPVGAVAGQVPAGFWIRLVAYVIDQAILFVPTIIALVLLEAAGIIPLGEADSTSVLDFDPALNLIGLVREGAYFTLLIGLRGQTFGKRMLGLRVLRVNGERISYLRSLGRYLSYFVSSLLFGLGFLFIAWTDNKRGWHDHICDTMVVKVERQV